MPVGTIPPTAMHQINRSKNSNGSAGVTNATLVPLPGRTADQQEPGDDGSALFPSWAQLVDADSASGAASVDAGLAAVRSDGAIDDETPIPTAVLDVAGVPGGQATPVVEEQPTPVRTVRPEPVVTPAPEPEGAGVERWRPLVASVFPSWAVDDVLAVMECESHGQNVQNAGGGPYFGPMQVWSGNFLPGEDWWDVPTNIRVAFRVWSATGWSLWSCKP